ncbi:hypothetical protein [Ignicoccus hospitalis]|uniref:Uncharacterized protein n=1 Tax=Ignicoccus hospitalis (strain KIN4/I / DSM 18386 / JCM 14125) TaxID=453591 RepID=A8ABW6_IGNH4|nr:hypothetical protein [Ignicoccus hospitalis]ABU82418.1 hypothetical protein Igni_1242 [Ignicoccus hospitalis KIN4/I]HIH90893.1 hypothetical protein [Desulfurococcaceae archaeon]
MLSTSYGVALTAKEVEKRLFTPKRYLKMRFVNVTPFSSGDAGAFQTVRLRRALRRGDPSPTP